MPPPPHLSVTVCPAGSPYTNTMTGYLRAGSNDDGLSMKPSSVTPPPMSTVRNSTGGLSTVVSFPFNADGSVSWRSEVCAGSATTSMTGGVSKRDHVWNARRPPGATS